MEMATDTTTDTTHDTGAGSATPDDSAPGATMRAAVYERYGGPEVVRLVDVARPEPRGDEVRIRVEAVAVTSADARIRAARFPRGFAVPARVVFGVTRPRRTILGSCFSGVVDEVGSHVGDLSVGDRVCGTTGMCFGAHAEQVCVAAPRLVRLPDNVTHEAAAGVVFGGTTALWFLRHKAGVGPGASVLVNGASGAIGTNAVQLAALADATVTGVTSAANLELVRDLGAAHVIDHTARGLGEVTDRYDVVLDTVGNLTIATGRRLLADGGRLVLAVAPLGQTLRARRDVIAGPAPDRTEHVATLVDLVASGALRVVNHPVMPLDDIVAAHRLVDSGHKVGNVVVSPRG
jgi:NADPH:quinone reductase-like Zn-dependent oxidoreductase